MVREAIKDQMDWEKLGYRCIGDCEDGEEALAFIERETPDVVLTDIGMPFVDGLELTRVLSRNYPQVKVVIFTGYDDFELAQQAVKLHAADYILKPVTSAELEAILVKLRSDMEQENRRKQDYERLKRRMAESMPLLRERFLERMVTSPMTDKAMTEGFSLHRIEWQGAHLIEAAIHADVFESDERYSPSDLELFRFAVYNIAQEIAGGRPGTEVFRDVENRVIVLFSGTDPEILEEVSLKVSEAIHQAVTAHLPLRVTIGIGRACRLGEHAPLVHQSALSALDYRFVTESSQVIRISDMERRPRPALWSAVAWENELITKLKTGTPQEMDEWIARLFSAFREQVFPIDICYIYLQRIVLTLMHTLYETDSRLTHGFSEADNPITRMYRFANLEEIETWMKELCVSATLAIRSTREDQNAVQVEKAIAYIKQHYSDPDLSLTTVCKQISMSVSYFSTLFKQYTGKTFVEYLTHERMEKAKELLKLTSLKQYEIAYAVGYADPHYFSGAFKKHTGDSPTEYRQKMVDKRA